jgi:diguanylate cyclase (GGDEF)-like protein/PAS domain S-box-containing protein
MRGPQPAVAARIGGGCLVGGALLALGSLLLPGVGDRVAILVTAAIAAALGVFRFVAGPRQPWWAAHVFGAAGTGLVTSGFAFGGDARWAYLFFYFWIALYFAYLFPWRQALLQLGILATAYAAVLVSLGPASLAPILWLSGVGTLAGAAVLVALLRRRVEELQREKHGRLERLVDERTTELAASEERYRELFENAHDVVFTLDLERRITSINRAGERLTGYRRTDLVGRSIEDILVGDDLTLADEQLDRKLRGETNATRYDIDIVAADGRRLPLEVSTRLVFHGGKPVGVQGVARDITERRALERQLVRQALHDSLTGLANRTLFEERVADALASRAGAAVLFLDVDDFKSVNDRFGHEAGDDLLCELGRRLEECVRPQDTAARLGGDEFAVLALGLPDEAALRQLADRIAAALAVPFVVEHRELYVRTSIGVARSAGPERTARQVMREADAAMYRTKTLGKSGVGFFEPEALTARAERLELAGDLRRAVDRDEFRLAYQPIVDLASGATVGLEALLRWPHPTRGLVLPPQFLPVLAESGLVASLTEGIVRRACARLRDLRERYALGPEFSMAVNLSPRQLVDPGLVAAVGAALEQEEVNPSALVLELTGAAFVHGADDVLESLARLKRLGVRIAIDDFGAGESRFEDLRRLPADVLKVGKPLVDRVASDVADAHVVQAIVEVARILGLTTVAEGIEHAEQRERLVTAGCELGQGYYFSRPLDEADLDRFLADEQPPAAVAV